jgi:hypothetical protein
MQRFHISKNPRLALYRNSLALAQQAFQQLRIGAAVALLAAAGSAQASPITIYSDTLTGTGALGGVAVATSSGTAGGTSGATWAAGDWIKTAGGAESTTSGVGQSAWLPFTPQTGYIYTLTANLSSSNDSWTTLGFSPTATTTGNFWGNSIDWVLATNGGDRRFHAGPGYDNGVTWGGDGGGAPGTVSIVLDTTTVQWTTYATLTDAANPSGVTSSVFTYDTNPTDIGYVGFGAFEPDATHTSANFSLTGEYITPKTGTTTTLVSSVNPSATGDAVTFTATVTPTPTGGTVQFYDNAVALDSPVTVTDGLAPLTTSALDAGSHSITATYSGNSDYAASSTTEATIQTVTGPSPAKNILTFGANVAGSIAVINTTSSTTGTIAWTVPYGTSPAALAPAFTLSDMATASPPSNTSRNFTTSKDYTVTAQDLTTKVYTVTVTVAAQGPGGVIDGLALWLDASASAATMTLTGSTVTEWRDKMGSSAKVTLQGGAPTLLPSGIGGVPTVHFDNTSWMNDGVNHQAPVTIFYVSRQTGGSNGRVLGACLNNWGLGYNDDVNNWYYFGGGEGDGSAPDTSAHLYAATIQGSESTTTVYANGTVIGTPTGNNSGPNNLELNGWLGESALSDCDISEVVVYHRILTSDELNAVGYYLAAKYGLTTDYTPPTQQTPTITATGSPLTALTTTYGTAAAATSFSLSGSDLTGAPGNLTVTPPAGFEVSLSNSADFTTSLSVPYSGATLTSTPVYVRLAATANVVGSPYSGDITVTGGGVASPAIIATAPSTVNKATPTATLAANNSPQPYTGSGHAATVIVSTSSVAGGVANVLTGGTATQTSVGTYEVTADFVPTDSDNYHTLPSLPAGNFTITANYASWAASQVPPMTGGPTYVGTDGLTNQLVYALDLKTDGTNGAPGTLTGNKITFTKRSAAITNGDVTYSIETSPNLQPPWSAVVTHNPGSTDATIFYDLPTGQGKIFARLKVIQAP